MTSLDDSLFSEFELLIMSESLIMDESVLIKIRSRLFPRWVSKLTSWQRLYVEYNS